MSDPSIRCVSPIRFRPSVATAACEVARRCCRQNLYDSKGHLDVTRDHCHAEHDDKCRDHPTDKAQSCRTVFRHHALVRLERGVGVLPTSGHVLLTQISLHHMRVRFASASRSRALASASWTSVKRSKAAGVRAPSCARAGESAPSASSMWDCVARLLVRDLNSPQTSRSQLWRNRSDRLNVAWTFFAYRYVCSRTKHLSLHRPSG